MNYQYHMLAWVLRALALIVVLGLLVTIVFSVRAVQRHDIKLLGVQSGSMEPKIKKGDAVMVRKIEAHDLVAGDIVTYRTAESSRLTTHRIHSITPDKKQLVTKGDANLQPDGILSSTQIEGKAIAVAPYAAKLANMIRSPVGMIAFLYLPIIALILYEASRLQHFLRRPYRLQR